MYTNCAMLCLIDQWKIFITIHTKCKNEYMQLQLLYKSLNFFTIAIKSES